LGAVLVGLYLLYLVAVKTKKQEKPSTTQDIVGKKAAVNDDGIIEAGGVFRACLYVSQVNMRTNTDMEKYQVWVAFRSMLNELGLPYTLLQLSQFIDVREYATWYQERLEKVRLTPELQGSGKDVVKFINGLDEDKNSRDYSGYIVLHYNPESDSIDSGVATGNAQFDEILKKIMGKRIVTKAEKRNLSRQILAEAMHITAGYAEQMGMSCYRLNKAQVYNLAYRILQKDYSAFSSPEEASEAQCFTPFHDSLTKRALQLELEEEGDHANKTA
jgi:hypothetical protein